jgi:hypothetical protein
LGGKGAGRRITLTPASSSTAFSGKTEYSMSLLTLFKCLTPITARSAIAVGPEEGEEEVLLWLIPLDLGGNDGFNRSLVYLSFSSAMICSLRLSFLPAIFLLPLLIWFLIKTLSGTAGTLVNAASSFLSRSFFSSDEIPEELDSN